MTEQPQTWHYGLVAQSWADFDFDEDEFYRSYYRSVIERHGQPALDAGCGAGRLLLPFLRDGIDVDGVDLSGDMLDRCREVAAAHGLSPSLYQQAMHELDLPRRYKTIFVCESFGLGSNRKLSLQALQRFYEHLEPGGVLALDQDEPDSHFSWVFMDPEKRRELPQEWTRVLGTEQAKDGAVYEFRNRVIAFDPVEHSLTNQIRVDLVRDGEVVAQEVHTMDYDLFFRDELQQMLETAGFNDIEVLGVRDDMVEEVTPDHYSFVFLARR